MVNNWEFPPVSYFENMPGVHVVNNVKETNRESLKIQEKQKK
jgi:hypothetical protein